jgi:drug/metabolite transporter (DMT)-like permease
LVWFWVLLFALCRKSFKAFKELSLRCYLVLQYIPLSRKAIIASTRGLFALAGSYLYFGEFPKTVALIGGLITIAGVLFIAFAN